MIKEINSKYCRNNLVQVMPYTADSHLILSADEIILLKIGGKVLINKYTNHPSRHLFPFSDKEQDDSHHFTEIFEYNKMYLNYRGRGGFSFHQDYFFKGNDRALFCEESLPCDERQAVKNVQDLTREEIENIFNSNNYDLMVVMDGNGIISFVKSKKDGIELGHNIIPSDEEIVKREVNSRIGDHNLAKIFNNDLDNEEYKKASIPKTIDEIKEFKIVGPASLFRTYSHILLTSKEGKFNLMWFKIDFVEKDKFRLTTSPIEVLEPTIDDVMKYLVTYGAEFTPEPYQALNSAKVMSYMEEEQQMVLNSIIKPLDEDEAIKLAKLYCDEPKSPYEETGFQKTLKRIFKRK